MSKDKLGCASGTSALIATASLGLRDQIALIVLVEKLKRVDGYHDQYLAEQCYSLADAMLEARD